MNDDEVPPSELVAGKYQLTRLLGRGGMGSVWEGVHNTLGTQVAVKFIEAEHAESPEARSRFVNEAKAAAKLQSKHVVQVYDHGLGDDGRPYIVMEFLSGEPLDARLDRCGRLSLEETARLLGQVARALAKAHQAGIVHRDLKPENVFLVWDEEDQTDVVKVVDFGIAKITEALGEGSSATRTGSLLGTPHYMSPEQARGLRSVDFRSDLWSLGVIAFRCVTGHLPFDGEAVGDLLVRICTEAPVRPTKIAPDLPPEFDDWTLKALAATPDGRFASAKEMIAALSTVAGVPAPSFVGLADVSGTITAVTNPDARFSSGPTAHTPVNSPEGPTQTEFTQATAPAAKSGSPLPKVAGVLLAGLVLAGGVFAAVSASSSTPEVGGELATVPPPAESAVVPPTEPTVSPTSASVEPAADEAPDAGPEAGEAADSAVAVKVTPKAPRVARTKPPSAAAKPKAPPPATSKPVKSKPKTGEVDIGY